MKISEEELQALFNDTKNMMESVIETERFAKLMRKGEVEDASADDLALYEELLFYMRGHLQLLKIICHHNGLKL